MFLDGRPPVNVGVTSGGDIFGGSAVTFSDVLGDKQFNMYAASISQYRTLSFSYLNLARRFNYALQGYSQTQFFYGHARERVLRPGLLAAIIDRDLADGDADGARRHGLRHLAVQPLPPRRAVRRHAAVQARSSTTRACRTTRRATSSEQFGRQLFADRALTCRSASTFVQETTVFREFGPLAGNTMRLSYEVAPKIGNTLVAADGRRRRALLHAPRRRRACWRCARAASRAGATRRTSCTSAATPRCAATSTSVPRQQAAFFNAELRFPFIEAMLTPIGVLGGIRGVFFANMGGAHFDGQPFKWLSRRAPTTVHADHRLPSDPTSPSAQTPIYGPPRTRQRLAPRRRRASYGIGLETFALGFPIHFDWSWRTLLNKDWEDVLFAAVRRQLARSASRSSRSGLATTSRQLVGQEVQDIR